MKLKLADFFRNVFLFFIIITSLRAYSQSEVVKPVTPDSSKASIIVSGRVIDSLLKKPIPYLKLNIIYVAVPEKSLSVLTKNNGAFEAEIPTVCDTLIFQFSGELFKTNVIRFPKPTNNIDLGTLFLVSRGALINEVTVTAKKRNIDINKRTYTVKGLPESETPIAASFIKTIPGIQHNGDDYTMAGFKKAAYYLNGVESSKTVIDNLPFILIDKVEIISSPPLSTGLKANQFIINVITKKTSELLLGGQVSGDVSAIRNTTSGLLSSYLTYKNLFINYTGNKYINKYDADRTSSLTVDQNPLLNLASSEHDNYKVSPFFNSLTVQYLPKSKLSFTTSGNYDDQNISFNQNSFTHTIVNSNGAFFNETSLKSKAYNGNATIRYKVSDSSTFYILGCFNHTKNNDLISDQTNEVSSLNTDIINVQRFSENKSAAFQLRNETTFKGINFESGFSFENYNLNSNFAQDTSGVASLFGYTSYHQKSFAPSLTITKPFKIGTLMIGGRAERNEYAVVSNDNNAQYKFYRWNFLPKFTFLKPSEKSGTFIFSYQRDMELPNADQLSLAQISFRPNQASSGNPLIRPELVNSFNLYNMYEIGGASFTSSLYYLTSTNYIAKGPYEIESDAIINQFDNVGKKRTMGLDVAINKTFLKVLTTITDIAVEAVKYDASHDLIVDPNFRGNLYINNWNFKFSEDFTYQIKSTLSANFLIQYKSREYDLFETRQISSPNTALSINKSWFKDKLNARISWNEMFNWGNKVNSYYHSPGVIETYYQTTRMQNVGFSLTYNFGKVKTSDDDLATKKVESKNIKKTTL